MSQGDDVLSLRLRMEMIDAHGDRRWVHEPLLVRLDEEVGEAIVDTLAHVQRLEMERTEAERELPTVVIDRRAPLERSITVSVLEEETGNRYPQELDRTFGELDLEEEMTLLVERGSLDVGGRFLRRIRSGVPQKSRHHGRSGGRVAADGSREDYADSKSEPPQGRAMAPDAVPQSDAAVRLRRIQTEAHELLRLAEMNPRRLVVTGPSPFERVWTRGEPLQFRLEGLRGWVRGTDGRPHVADAHEFSVAFPSGYPFQRPFRFMCRGHGPTLHHPNVDPDGDFFVCLFTEATAPSRRSMLEAMARLEDIISWQRANLTGVHAMNERAVKDWTERADEMRPLRSPKLVYPL